jgi:hypothetical protein
MVFGGQIITLCFRNGGHLKHWQQAASGTVALDNDTYKVKMLFGAESTQGGEI